MRQALATLLRMLYRAVVHSGLLELPWAQRVFLWAYGHYKQWLEARHAERLVAWVPAGGVVIDVGANVGFFTLKFAHWVGPSGQVLAFEPAPRNVEHLSNALTKAKLAARVIIVAAAAAERAGSAYLELNPFHPGDHKLGAQGVPVEVTTLDLQVSAWGLKRVDLVKIDVQGAHQGAVG